MRGKISSYVRIFFKHVSQDSELNKHESPKCYSDISFNLQSVTFFQFDINDTYLCKQCIQLKIKNQIKQNQKRQPYKERRKHTLRAESASISSFTL